MDTQAELKKAIEGIKSCVVNLTAQGNFKKARQGLDLLVNYTTEEEYVELELALKKKESQ